MAKNRATIRTTFHKSKLGSTCRPMGVPVSHRNSSVKEVKVLIPAKIVLGIAGFVIVAGFIAVLIAFGIIS